MFAFLHGEIALISVAYLSGSCKLLPCLLETAPQHCLPGPVSHLLRFFLVLEGEAAAQKASENLLYFQCFNRESREVSQKPIHVVTGAYAVVGVCGPAADLAK